jgi:uncharacterized membrane protein YeiH
MKPSKQLRNLRNHVLILDAAGLALFAVVGRQKALGYRINPAMAALLGVLSGIGGGMLRDVLVGQLPTVLRAELYALAALRGAVVMVVGYVLNLPPTATANHQRGALLRTAPDCHTARLAPPRRRPAAAAQGGSGCRGRAGGECKEGRR